MAAEDLEELKADAPEEDSPGDPEEDSTGKEAESESLSLEVEVASPSACERHVTVTISRGDIDRYLDNAYSELMTSATVPGFRAGRAPRKLVEP